jgi:hypothetical protein
MLNFSAAKAHTDQEYKSEPNLPRRLSTLILFLAPVRNLAMAARMMAFGRRNGKMPALL